MTEHNEFEAHGFLDRADYSFKKTASTEEVT